MTGSIDRLVHLIDFNSQIVGTLKQGYKTMPNYQWDFPVSKYLKSHPERLTRMETMMEEVRKQRDKDLSHKKLLEIRLLKEGKLNSISFAGSQLMGMAATKTESMYNTAQSAAAQGQGIPGQNRYGASQATESAYPGAAGMYNTSESAYSMFPRKDKTKMALQRAK